MKLKTVLSVVFSFLLSAFTLWVGGRIYSAFREQRSEILQLRLERDSLANRAYQAERRYTQLMLRHNQHRIHHLNDQINETTRKALADSMAVRLPDFRILPRLP